MTLILGAKCRDGVVFVGDRKVVFDDETSSYRNKIFKQDPLIIGSSGSISGFTIFKDNVLQLAKGSSDSFDVDSFVQKAKVIYKNVNDAFQKVKQDRDIDVLIAVQTKDRGAVLVHYYPELNKYDPVPDYKLTALANTTR